MSKINRNLFQRTLAGIVLVVVILFCIWWSVWTFFGLFLIVTILSVNEFHKMSNSASISVINWLAMLASALLFVGGFVYYGMYDIELIESYQLSVWLFICSLLLYI